MAKSNFKTTNMCLFCKYWIGMEGDIDYITGEVKYKNMQGICRENERTSRPTDICYHYLKKLEFL